MATTGYNVILKFKADKAKANANSELLKSAFCGALHVTKHKCVMGYKDGCLSLTIHYHGSVTAGKARDRMQNLLDLLGSTELVMEETKTELTLDEYLKGDEALLKAVKAKRHKTRAPHSEETKRKITAGLIRAAQASRIAKA